MQNPRSPWEANSSVVDLFARHYGELRDVARRHLRNERRGHTLQTTALVHEAFLRLRSHRSAFIGRTHFIALAATTMRRLLVEHARARTAGKRRCEAGQPPRHEAGGARESRLLEALAVDEALDTLTRLSPRTARVAELRLFAGFSVEETAQAVGVSTRTVKEDWRLAKAWLTRRLRRGPASLP